MSSHYAIADVWIGNLDSEAEADHVRDLLDAALGVAGYQASITITVNAYPEQQ